MKVVATEKKKKEKYIPIKKNPLTNLGFLLNQFHSIEYRHATESEKSEMRKILGCEIERQCEYVDKKFKKDILLAMKDRTQWEFLRETIFAKKS